MNLFASDDRLNVVGHINAPLSALLLQLSHVRDKSVSHCPQVIYPLLQTARNMILEFWIADCNIALGFRESSREG